MKKKKDDINQNIARLPTYEEWKKVHSILDNINMTHLLNLDSGSFWCYDSKLGSNGSHMITGKLRAPLDIFMSDGTYQYDKLGMRLIIDKTMDAAINIIEFLDNGESWYGGCLYIRDEKIPYPKTANEVRSIRPYKLKPSESFEVRFESGISLSSDYKYDDFQIKWIKAGNYLVSSMVFLTEMSWKKLERCGIAKEPAVSFKKRNPKHCSLSQNALPTRVKEKKFTPSHDVLTLSQKMLHSTSIWDNNVDAADKTDSGKIKTGDVTEETPEHLSIPQRHRESAARLRINNMSMGEPPQRKKKKTPELPSDTIPCCKKCSSSEGLFNKDGNKNVFCGQCGEKIDWTKNK